MPEQRQTPDIAIIGMAGRFPGARTIEAFWQNLCAGIEAVSFFPDQELIAAGVAAETCANPRYVKAGVVLEDVENFDAAFFGMSAREAEILDPQQRLALECAWEALEHAGYDSMRFAGRIGVYGGAAMSSYLGHVYANPAVIQSVGYFQAYLANEKDHLTTRVAFKLNLTGPAVGIQTACSTSLVATHLACESLLNGQCDIALALGAMIRVPQRQGYWHEEGGVTSPDGHCRAFDARAGGTIFGNGVGVVVLKPLNAALEDGDTIYAVIRGSAINNDGAAKIGYTAPSADGQAQVIAEAQLVADIDPQSIGYIEAHGTGTPLGDPIEIAALTQVFRSRTSARGFCAIGSVKTNIGHLEVAAGMAGLLKTVLILHHGRIPPSLHFETPNPYIDFASSPFVVNTQLRDWPEGATPRRAGVSSFGMGGTNAHVVLEQAPEDPPAAPAPRPWQLLILSAKTAGALDAMTRNLADDLDQHPQRSLADVAYTLQVGRRAFAHRRMLVCRTAADACAALRQPDQASLPTAFYDGPDRQVVFLFPGQGAQYAGMLCELYEGESVFRGTVDRCARLLVPHLGLDIRHLIYPDRRGGEEENGQSPISNLQSPLDQTQYAQSALFVVEYALAQLLLSWGVRPQVMIGHSIGEYVAATISGVFAIEDALALVAARGRLMGELPQGAMLAVALPAETLAPLLRSPLALAADNSATWCVVAGPAEAITDLAAQLAAQGHDTRRLHTSHAFHSPAVAPAVGPFTALVAQVPRKPPSIPWISNVSGTWISADEAVDPAYWGRQLREPVQFRLGLATLGQGKPATLLEVGPGRSLSSFARQELPSWPLAGVARTVQQRESDTAVLLQALGQLWLSGVAIDWEGLSVGAERRRVALPTYPFERQRYWVEPPAHTASAPPVDATITVPSWQPTLRPDGCTLDTPRCWVLLSDGGELSAALVSRLSASDQEVIEVAAGPAFARTANGYQIQSGTSAQYDALLDALVMHTTHPLIVIYLRGLQPAFQDDPTVCHDLVALAQALASRAAQCAAIRLLVVAGALHAVTRCEHVPPGLATLAGVCQALGQEWPQLNCCSLDLGLGAIESQQAVRRILDEAGGGASAVAYRRRQRWAGVVTPVPLASATARSINGQGTYLVIGAGAAAPAWARLLVRLRPGAVALIMPPTGDDERPVHDAAFSHWQAPLNDPAQLGRVIGQIAQAGPICGLIVVIDRLADVATTEPGAAMAALAHALRGHPLETALLLHGPIEDLPTAEARIAAAGAAALLDTTLQNNSDQTGLPWVRVCWQPWPRGDTAPVALEDDPVVSALLADLIARVPDGAVMVRRDMAAHTRDAPVEQPADAPVSTYLRPNFATAYVAPRNELEHQVVAIWQEQSGIAPVGIHDHFLDLGGHSLLAARIVFQLQEVFQLSLPPQLLFEAPTVAEVARQIETALQAGQEDAYATIGVVEYDEGTI